MVDAQLNTLIAEGTAREHGHDGENERGIVGDSHNEHVVRPDEETTRFRFARVLINAFSKLRRP
jgi:hypothetical protein